MLTSISLFWWDSGVICIKGTGDTSLTYRLQAYNPRILCMCNTYEGMHTYLLSVLANGHKPLSSPICRVPESCLSPPGAFPPFPQQSSAATTRYASKAVRLAAICTTVAWHVPGTELARLY